MTAIPLSVEVHVPDPEVALVAVGGHLDLDTGTELHCHLANQLHHGRRHLVVDLSAVPFMDSSGLNIILRAYQATRGMGGSVQLAAPRASVRRILDLTGVSLTMPVRETVGEALRHVQGTPQAAGQTDRGDHEPAPASWAGPPTA